MATAAPKRRRKRKVTKPKSAAQIAAAKKNLVAAREARSRNASKAAGKTHTKFSARIRKGAAKRKENRSFGLSGRGLVDRESPSMTTKRKSRIQDAILRQSNTDGASKVGRARAGRTVAAMRVLKMKKAARLRRQAARRKKKAKMAKKG